MGAWVWMVLSGIGGFAVGCVIFSLGKRKDPVGTLRMDRGDPGEAPYLFLEVEPGGMDRIFRERTVHFRVDLTGYLPRK